MPNWYVWFCGTNNSLNATLCLCKHHLTIILCAEIYCLLIIIGGLASISPQAPTVYVSMAASSKFSAVCLTYPYQVIRARLQVRRRTLKECCESCPGGQDFLSLFESVRE